jgi:hypothetical protein
MNPDNPIVLDPTAGDSPKMFYTLYKTPMTKDGAPVLAARIKRRPMNLQKLAEQMARENPKYRAEEISGLLTHFIDVVNNALKDGHTVHLGQALRLAPAIRGAFTSEEDTFDPKRHKLYVAACVGKTLQENFKHYPLSAMQKLERA